MRIARLGSDYGGWTVDLDSIPDHSVVISAGVGEDISFDEALAAEKDVTILTIDPTEKSRRFMQNRVTEKVRFIPRAVAPQGVDEIKLYRNSNPDWVSDSCEAGHNNVGNESYLVKCISIADLRGCNDISLIKLDIEGAEYSVLDECIGVKQICVEFHSSMISGLTWRDDMSAIRKLEDAGYTMIDHDQKMQNFTFLLT